MRQRGRDWDARTSIAPASSWHLQTGLIQPRNEAPSIYKERVEARHEGLQHMPYWTEDYRGFSPGYRVGHQGSIGGEKGRLACFDTEAHSGTVIEISDISSIRGRTFAHIRKVAEGWDGSAPVRIIR